MGIEERREREKLQRRSDILDAAESVFFKKGPESATMDEVAEVAELSKGTLYLYFPSKEDLYLGINTRAIQKLHDLFAAAIDRHRNGLDQIEAIGRAYFTFAAEYPNYFDSLLHFEKMPLESMNQTQSFQKYCELGGRVTALVEHAVANGVADGTIHKGHRPPEIGILLWAMSSGVIMALAKKGEMLQGMHGISSRDLTVEFFALMRVALTGKADE